MKYTSRIVRAWRLFRLGLHILRGVLTAFLVLPWGSTGLRMTLTREWSRSLLGLLGVRLEIRGNPPEVASRNVLLVSNHVSWLDIYLLNAVRPLRFVSKAEVRSWPVVGWLAVFTGTLFLERGRRRDTARVNDAVTAALAGGDCVAFFPEGTTTDGTHIKPFLSSLLQAAINAQSEIRPVALRYVLPDGGADIEPAYYGDMSMMDSLRNILARKAIRAELLFLEPIASSGKQRRELAHQAEQAISSALYPAGRRTAAGTAGDPPAAAH
ncbi:1-acyl-sn-glycerol-3-phosphate acyltransferase [Sulfurimicrobium lacus]|uniref:1-acyl-sn-glycerol-3-phosphate acyltransferase n=1 Tax=Sulfurimicrobium lacus TaxID=2715678 RepID=A0A6F8VGL6_9PROT|nr:lysophospholipid acyltransferase family protein [Sulfurimicrobium lacus]BCB28490.1 1-acyl-sn-glycerol-3-phosphate acyltransferase [Sulfurimicrobium lacus]